MKDVCMLLGFGVGLVTGVMLYKYSAGAKKAVDEGEKALVKEIEKADQKVKKAIQKKTK